MNALESGNSRFDAARVRLRPVTPADFPVLYGFQCDPESNRMAVTKPRSPEAFAKVMTDALANPLVVARVIVVPHLPLVASEGSASASAGGANELILGSISCFQMDGVDAVGYWVAREHWGKGIATRAVALLVAEVTRRPLHARTAASNAASIKVLLTNGFRATGMFMEAETERYPACEVVSFVLD